jgi:hypothetical protein
MLVPGFFLLEQNMTEVLYVEHSIEPKKKMKRLKEAPWN